MKQPLISIICATYGRTEMLEEAIYSVLHQSYKNWEMIIVNDLESQILSYIHPQIRIFNCKDRFPTLGDKRNFCIENSNGEFITTLDDDDILLPDYLEHFVSFMQDEYDWIRPNKGICLQIVKNYIHAWNYSPAPSFLFRRSIWEKYKYKSFNTKEQREFVLPVQKLFKGKELDFKNENVKYLYRYDPTQKLSYNVSIMMSKSKTDGQTYEDIKQFIDTQKSSSLIRSGELQLNPHWNQNYTEMVEQHYKNIKSSSEPFMLKSTFVKNITSFTNSVPNKGLISTVERLIGENKEKNITPEKLKEIIQINEQKVNATEHIKKSWLNISNTWEMATSFANAVKSRGVLSTAAQVLHIDSNSGEKIDSYTYNERFVSCFGNNTKPKCEVLKIDPLGNTFCGACGCGANPLAKLTSIKDEYTKLYYPELKCPLEKKGFSNYKIPLSVLIPVLNDNDEVNETINSIRNTAPDDIEIIVVDDGSDTPVVIKNPTVKLIRLEKRVGAGKARHIAATHASSDYILLLDSHMRFTNNWFNSIRPRLINNPKTIWCGVCLGLSEENMNITDTTAAYYGADFVFYDEQKRVFDGVWTNLKPGLDYEISCLMGACYFMHKDWFFYIKGLEGNKMWGSEEPFLSLKTYLAGGNIKLAKDVKIGHKFRNVASYSTTSYYILYNKIRSMKKLLPDNIYQNILSKIPDNSLKHLALNQIEQDKDEIREEQNYYKTIFKNDVNWFCSKFNIKLPE